MPDGYDDMDTEAILARMFRIKRKLVPELEQEYEELRDVAVERLGSHQPFLDEEGNKQVAFPVRPDKVVVHPEALEEFPQDLVDKIAPRKIDRALLSAAIARGDLTDEQIEMVLEIRHGGGTPHIRFDDPAGRE